MADHHCSVLNWNVRGLNNLARRRIVRDLASLHHASVVCIQETKLQLIDRQIVLETFGTAFADSFCFLPAQYTRGGILLAFSVDFFDITSTSGSLNSVSANVVMRASAASWSISAVYGPQTDSEKLSFIDELKNLRAAMLLAWLLLGDFNLICRAEDKNNAMVNRRLINSFRAALNAMEVTELRLHSRRFTWASNCHLQTRAKIDHMFRSPD